MQLVTLTIDDDLLDAVDALARQRGYASRLDAVRDLLRGALGWQDPDPPNRSAPSASFTGI